MTLSPPKVLRYYLCFLGASLCVQGVASLLAGSGTLVLPESVRPLAQADPLHAIIHIVWGLVMIALVVTRGDTALIRLALVFGAFYTCLAILGTWLVNPFGLQLGTGENLFHWVVGPLTLGCGLWARSSRR